VAGSVWRVRDELWEAVEPLLPEHPADPRGGRRVRRHRLPFEVGVLGLNPCWIHCR
jgi:transposase